MNLTAYITTLEDKKKAVLLVGLRVMLYSLMVAAVTRIILWDAQRPDHEKFSEHSYTEYAQESALVLITILFLLGIWYFPKQVVIAYLLGGVFGMAIIREHDAFLDTNVADGAWQLIVTALITLILFLVWKERKQVWTQLYYFIHTRAFGIIVSGMFIVFIFSRLYGNKHIWLSVMGEENYLHTITRANEEALELLGYTIILIGAIEFLFFSKPSGQNPSGTKDRKMALLKDVER